MKALGIIFSDMNDWKMSELASNRSVAAIPFGGRYRLIDFALSNMVNSGINKLCIITNSNYRSLMEHVGSGKDWDLSRKKGGVLIFPPYSSGESHGLYKGRLDALKRVLDYIRSSTEKYVILSDSDTIYNINYNDIIKYHIEKGADITAVCTKTYLNRENSVHKIIYDTNEEKRARDILVYPITSGEYKVGMDTWVLNKDFLEMLIYDAIAHNLKDFSHDVLAARVNSLKIYTYEYNGFYAHIDSLLSYYKNSMELLKLENQRNLFYANTGPIYTKTKDSPPTKYGMNVEVKHSIIASGCIIEGNVENSIIFRGVKIGKNSLVKNSILMPHTEIGENTQLDSIISDTYTFIKNGRTLLGYTDCPFFLKKYSIV